MASGAMVGWCSGSRWPSRFSLGFGSSTDTRAPVRRVRGGDTTEQDGMGFSGHVCVRAAACWTGQHTGSPPRHVHAGQCVCAKFRQRGHGNNTKLTVRAQQRNKDRTMSGEVRTLRVCAHTNSWPKKGKALVLECARAYLWWFDQEVRALAPLLSKRRVLAAQPRQRHRLVNTRDTNLKRIEQTTKWWSAHRDDSGTCKATGSAQWPALR
jgi:hypothetical protein